MGDGESVEGDRINAIADSVIHIWYSAFLPAVVLADFQRRVQPLVRDVCSRIQAKPPGTALGKTWLFNQIKIRVILSKEQWFLLGDYFGTVKLSCQEARALRCAVTLAPERVDFRERWLFKECTAFTRVAKQKFREDGVLLPFGQSRRDFVAPNPTLFRKLRSWPMDDKTDPLDGWPLWEVHHFPSIAKEDCYGKLHAYLIRRFTMFLLRLRQITTRFEMYCADAADLSTYLDKDQFARIEVANICDSGYLGIYKTLATLSPLLQSPHSNPFATLLGLFMNAVMEIVYRRDERDTLPNMDKLLRLLPAPVDILKVAQGNSADTLRIWDARTFVLEAEQRFQEYMNLYRFEELSTALHLVLRNENSIVEAWPMRLKLRHGEVGYQEEFDVLLGSNNSGLERHTEWARTS
ncbi:hypothetical protein LTR22_014584 [Elasticomyces elasticus]|nr:hypothetical protein LTR22_014584 [Elasticomyces elasticus]KAK5747296.1 hypothetical protein LTS12_022446 [Elasticomyces elasticus]